jgi:hypothetical protein
MRQILLIACFFAVDCAKGSGSKVEYQPNKEPTALSCTLVNLTRALADWFLIVESGDARRLGTVVDRRNFHWISVSSFGKGDTLISIHKYDQLAD